MPDDVMPSTAAELEAENAELRAENAELHRRIAVVDEQLLELRDEALARRADVRQLAESLPAEVSRRALLTQMLDDVVHHPDKAGMARRAVAKLGRGVRKAGRTVVGRLRPTDRAA